MKIKNIIASLLMTLVLGFLFTVSVSAQCTNTTLSGTVRDINAYSGGISGVTVRVAETFGAKPTVFITTTSGTNGAFSFTGLLPCTSYSVYALATTGYTAGRFASVGTNTDAANAGNFLLRLTPACGGTANSFSGDLISLGGSQTAFVTVKVNLDTDVSAVVFQQTYSVAPLGSTVWATTIEPCVKHTVGASTSSGAWEIPNSSLTLYGDVSGNSSYANNMDFDGVN